MMQIAFLVLLAFVAVWAIGYALVFAAIGCVWISDAIKSLFHRN